MNRQQKFIDPFKGHVATSYPRSTAIGDHDELLKQIGLQTETNVDDDLSKKSSR